VQNRIYIYPLTSKIEKLGLYNPYINDLINSFSLYFEFINKDKPSKYGIFDLLKFLKRTDYIFFNWIEKLPGNKGGIIQTLFLFFLFPVFRLFNIKVVWTMHNKLTHSTDYLFLKKAIFKTMLKKADYIFTHSSDGINFGTSLVPDSRKKIHYLPHPVKDRRRKKETTFIYNILIWGTISPYKGIDKFLKFLFENKIQHKYKILIIGKFTSKNYSEYLSGYSNENILIKDEFIENDILIDLIEQSKIVLFTYTHSSILSSGVLMDSLGYGANIVGPDVGAFADLAKEGIIQTFSGFEELVSVIDKQISREDKNSNEEKINKFLTENSWEKYAKKVSKIIG